MKCPSPALGERDLCISYLPIEGTRGVDLVAGILRDITEQKRATEDLQRSYGQLVALTAQLQSVREEERTRLARELHDQLGQSLTAIRIDLASIKSIPDRGQALVKLASLMDLVDQTIHSVRQISTDLRPGILDDLGLVAAVEWMAEESQSRVGIRFELNLPTEELSLNPDCATALFRIIQETLTNVARHAAATLVQIRLSENASRLTLEIQDNGRGIGAQPLSGANSLGIVGMRERARLLGGDLAILSDHGEGTTVRVSIPLARSRAARVGA
jgi:signal transduction histidine kinase